MKNSGRHQAEADASLALAVHHRELGNLELERSYARLQKYHLKLAAAFADLEAEEALCWDLMKTHPLPERKHMPYPRDSIKDEEAKRGIQQAHLTVFVGFNLIVGPAMVRAWKRHAITGRYTRCFITADADKVKEHCSSGKYDHVLYLAPMVKLPQAIKRRASYILTLADTGR